MESISDVCRNSGSGCMKVEMVVVKVTVVVIVVVVEVVVVVVGLRKWLYEDGGGDGGCGGGGDWCGGGVGMFMKKVA